jgi:hypothetical protein
MIRDPSDGSVKGITLDANEINKVKANPPAEGITGNTPVIDPTTSGLQTGSSKPENLARLEKARQWIRDYRAGKFKRTDGE